jgi:hypothetical protein
MCIETQAFFNDLTSRRGTCAEGDNIAVSSWYKDSILFQLLVHDLFDCFDIPSSNLGTRLRFLGSLEYTTVHAAARGTLQEMVSMLKGGRGACFGSLPESELVVASGSTNIARLSGADDGPGDYYGGVGVWGTLAEI